MSATGRSARRGADTERGFTLVELMVVLVILGLSAAAVLFALPTPGGRVRDAAERFAVRVRAAQDGAILSGRPMALAVDGGGYRFMQRARGQWIAPGDAALAQQAWGVGISARIGEGEPRTLFDPTGAVEPLTVTLTRDGERAVVRIAADGSVHVG